MHFSIVLLCSAANFLAHLSTIEAYGYEEIQNLNGSCYPKDTCSLPRDLDNPDVHNCDCSSLCVLYDTCCIDSPFSNISSHYERSASCRTIGQTTESIFMIDICSSSYKGPVAIRRRCEQTAKDWSDPFNNIPATNPKSMKTYKSLFCAICNNENAKELVLWQVMLDCSSLTDNMEICVKDKEFVLNNMLYIREKGLWGIWSWDSKTDWKFRHLALNYMMPPNLEPFVKKCRPNLISDCSPRWKDNRTRNMCKAYMGAVYFGDIAFRNVHCALCNGVRNFTGMSCHDTASSIYKSTVGSFGILLDIDLSDGEQVGNIEVKCGEDQVYDPFSKKCRTIECPIPGFVLKDKKCVPE